MKHTLTEIKKEKVLFNNLKEGDPCIIYTWSHIDFITKDRLCVKIGEVSFFQFDDNSVKNFGIVGEILVYPVKSFKLEAEY